MSAGRKKLYINADIAPGAARGDKVRSGKTEQLIGHPRGTVSGTSRTPKHNGTRGKK